MEAQPSDPSPAVHEVTIRAVILGLILAIVLGAANAYLALKAGMTISASIPASVISMAILRGLFRTGTILENNIVQTIATSGQSLAAGVIFTVPALVIIGAWKDFEFWPTTLITMLGGLLGVIFMVPLRRAFIVQRPDLAYPEGVACAEVLKAGEAGGGGFVSIAAGVALGGLIKFLASGAGVIKETLDGAVSMGRSVVYAGTDVSGALFAVGYIVGLAVAAQVFMGGAIAWFVAVPLMSAYQGGDAVDAAMAAYKDYVRYIGVGAMLVGGVSSLWQIRRGILGGLAGLRGFRGAQGGAEAVPRTDRDVPFIVLVVLFVFCCVGVYGLYVFLIGSHLVSLAATILMIVASFLFVAVSTYICGLIGSSNSPVSGMTICALLLTAGVLYVMGIRGEPAMLAVLGVAGVVCSAACTSGDIAQDLKTGQLVSATPANQQWVEFLGVIVTSFVFAPVLNLLHHNYGIGDKLRAPQAALFASLTEGFFGSGHLPLNMVYIGVGIGLAVLLINEALTRANRSQRLYLMPIAVGMYLPLSLTLPILIGGLLRWAVTRGRAETANDPGVLFGSGLIAGEGLMGIGLAGALQTGWFPLVKAPSTIASIIALVLLLAIYFRMARPTPPRQSA